MKKEIIKLHHIFIKEKFIDINSGKIELSKSNDKENFNHLVSVLRIKKGEEVLCSIIPFNFSFDYKVAVEDVSDEKVTFNIEEKLEANELSTKINLYQGITKSDKFEFIIEKAVELGVFSITPVENEFSVAKIEEKKIVAKLERYNKISKSAAEQSKRNIIPEVKKPITFGNMIEEIKGYNNILFYENADDINKTKENLKSIKDEVNIIIGPEGGFSNSEIEMAKQNSIKILTLGDRILRTETAALTALSILMYELQRN